MKNEPLCYAYKVRDIKNPYHNSWLTGFIEAENDLDAYNQLILEYNVKESEILLSLNGTWEKFQNEMSRNYQGD